MDTNNNLLFINDSGAISLQVQNKHGKVSSMGIDACNTAVISMYRVIVIFINDIGDVPHLMGIYNKRHCLLVGVRTDSLYNLMGRYDYLYPFKYNSETEAVQEIKDYLEYYNKCMA